MDSAPEGVASSVTGDVMVITIDRPARRNALDRPTTLQLAAAIDRFESDDAVSVAVLTGAGATFCAGMDLKAFADAAPGERIAEIEGRGFGGLTELDRTKPLIAAVEGHALAGGCELVLACDLVVASRGARFGLPEPTRGLAAGSGGLLRLPRRIPIQIAMEFALTGAHMTATDAHRWGLVNRLTADGDALAEAELLAGEIAANAPLAVRATKAIIDASRDWSADDMWDRQRDIVDAVLQSNDANEGARAFADKRPPRWSGS